MPGYDAKVQAEHRCQLVAVGVAVGNAAKLIQVTGLGKEHAVEEHGDERGKQVDCRYVAAHPRFSFDKGVEHRWNQGDNNGDWR